MILTQEVKIPITNLLELTGLMQFTQEEFDKIKDHVHPDQAELIKFLTPEEFYIRRREWVSQEPNSVENFLLPSL